MATAPPKLPFRGAFEREVDCATGSIVNSLRDFKLLHGVNVEVILSLSSVM